MAKESLNWGNMRYLSTGTGNNITCALDLPICMECVGFHERSSAEMQQWGGRFIPAIQKNADSVGSKRSRQVGSNGLEHLECQNNYYFDHVQLQPRVIMERANSVLTEYKTCMAAQQIDSWYRRTLVPFPSGVMTVVVVIIPPRQTIVVLALLVLFWVLVSINFLSFFQKKKQCRAPSNSWSLFITVRSECCHM